MEDRRDEQAGDAFGAGLKEFVDMMQTDGKPKRVLISKGVGKSWGSGQLFCCVNLELLGLGMANWEGGSAV